MGHVIDWEMYDYRSNKIKNQAKLISRLCECETAEELDPEHSKEVITSAIAGLCVDLISAADFLIESIQVDRTDQPRVADQAGQEGGG